MNTQLHLAFGIVEGRAHSDQDVALLRTWSSPVESERRARRAAPPPRPLSPDAQPAPHAAEPRADRPGGLLSRRGRSQPWMPRANSTLPGGSTAASRTLSSSMAAAASSR